MLNLSKCRIPEYKMIPVIEKEQNSIAPNTNIFETEVESGYGVADILFYSIDETSAKLRKSINSNRLKGYEVLETISIINDFNSEEIAITQLSGKLPYSKDYFLFKILPALEKSGIVENNNNKSLKIKNKYHLAVKESVAIEAKVSNWKRGLYQAYRYRKYADYSYLAIHQEYVKAPLENLDEFMKTNVGLIGVNTNSGETIVYYRPKKEKLLTSDVFKIYTNEFILEKMGFIN